MSEAVSLMLSVSQVTNPAWGSCYQLSNGSIDVLISPERGGRVVSFGPRGGRNVFWTNPKAPDYLKFSGNWLNWGGEKTWIWHQQEWRELAGKGWPPPVQMVSLSSGGSARL